MNLQGWSRLTLMPRQLDLDYHDGFTNCQDTASSVWSHRAALVYDSPASSLTSPNRLQFIIESGKIIMAETKSRRDFLNKQGQVLRGDIE